MPAGSPVRVTRSATLPFYVRAARSLAPFVILFVLVLVFFRKVLFGGHYLIPWDFRYFHLPLAAAIRGAIVSGYSPLWDPSTYCGRPLFADPQAQLFYIPTAIVVALSAVWNAIPLAYLLEWQLVLHVFAAGALTFVMLRRMGLSTPASLCGGAIYELGGFFASQAQHLGAIDTAAWIPLMWAAVWELRGAWSSLWFACLSIATAMCVLAGLPAVSSAALISSLLFAVALWIFQEGCWRQLVKVSVAFIIAAGLAAVILLPATQLTYLSVAKYRSDWLRLGGLPLQSLVSLVFPNFYHIFDLKAYKAPYNPTFLYLYCGLGGLLLALYSVWKRSMRGARPSLILLTLISALWMFGDLTPLGWLVAKCTPGLVLGSLYPSYAMSTFCLGMAALAGFGLDSIGRLGAAGKFAVAFLIAVDLIVAGSGRPMNTADVLQEPGMTWDQIDGSPRLPAELRRLTGQTYPPYRIDTFHGAENWATTAPLTGIPTANGYNPLALERVIQVRLSFAKGERWGAWYEIENLQSPVADMLGVRYIVSRQLISEQKLTKVEEFPGTNIYENGTALPRFWIVHDIRSAGTMKDAIEQIRRPDFDPSRSTVIEGAVPAIGVASGAGESVKTLAYQPGFIELKLHAATPAFLVTSEAYYPGWRSFVDSKEVPIYITNVAFRGIAVGAGDHTVSFRFNPRILQLSGAIAVLSLIVLAATVFGTAERA